MKNRYDDKLVLFGVSIVFLFLIIVLYHQLPNTFYQQDEWQALGNFETGGLRGAFSLYSLSLLDVLAGKGRFLATPFHYFFYHYSPFQVAYASILAIVFHLLNSVLLFIIFKRLFKGIFFAILAVIFFVTASVASQSITWMAASTTTLLSSFFAFLSLLSYIYYLEKKKVKWVWITLLFFIFSFFIKESSIFLLLVYPLIYFQFLGKKSNVKVAIKDHIPFFLYFILLVFAVFTSIFSEKDPSGLVVTAAPDSKMRLILHLILYPFISFSQVFIGGEFVYKMADSLGRLSYSRIWSEPYSVIVRETIAADFVSILLTVLLFIILFLICRVDKRLKKPIVWGVVYTLLSFLPYAVLDKQTSYFESRYYYYAVVGGGVIFASIIIFLRDLIVKITKLSIAVATIICVVFVLLHIWYQISLTHASLDRDLLYAHQRKNFLSQLKSEIPSLENKALFYISGNTEYFLETNRAPFQQGIGYTLMVWYYRSGTIPKEFITSNFLWVIGSEGYRESGANGFGVYSDMELVKLTAEKYRLGKNNIYGLYYDGEKKQLVNTTEKTRSLLGEQ